MMFSAVPEQNTSTPSPSDKARANKIDNGPDLESTNDTVHKDAEIRITGSESVEESNQKKVRFSSPKDKNIPSQKNRQRMRSSTMKPSVRFAEEAPTESDSETEEDEEGVDIKRGKVIVRARSSMRTDFSRASESTSQRDSSGENSQKRTFKRRNTKRVGLKTRLQSIYKGGDFVTDDHTASSMRTMVEGFDRLSKSMERGVNHMVVHALFGLILNIIQREISHYGSNDSYTIYLIVNILRGIVSFTTICMLYHSHTYWSTQVQFESMNKVFMSWESMWSAPRNYIPFLKDFFLFSIHEPPFLNLMTDIAISRTTIPKPIIAQNIFGLLMFARMFLIMRYANSSMYRGGTKILGIWHNFNFGLGFTVRNLLYTHPFSTIIPTLITMIIIAEYCLWSCERVAVNGMLSDPLDSLWVLLVTVTTVGYGDISPETHAGRAILVMASFLSQFIIAVIISTLHQKLHLAPFESRMVEFLAHAKSVKRLRTNAANVIKSGWKLSKVKRSKGILRGQKYQGPERSAFTDSIYTFQMHRNTVHAYDRRYRNDQLIRSMLEDISNQCQEAKMYYSAANEIAAATGRALKITEESTTRRGDGSYKYVEREYEIVDQRKSALRGAEVQDLEPTKRLSNINEEEEMRSALQNLQHTLQDNQLNKPKPKKICKKLPGFSPHPPNSAHS